MWHSRRPMWLQIEFYKTFHQVHTVVRLNFVLVVRLNFVFVLCSCNFSALFLNLSASDPLWDKTCECEDDTERTATFRRENPPMMGKFGQVQDLVWLTTTVFSHDFFCVLFSLRGLLGYPHSDNTWEYEDDMECTQLIDDYLKSIGELDEVSYEQGAPLEDDDDNSGSGKWSFFEIFPLLFFVDRCWFHGAAISLYAFVVFITIELSFSFINDRLCELGGEDMNEWGWNGEVHEQHPIFIGRDFSVKNSSGGRGFPIQISVRNFLVALVFAMPKHYTAYVSHGDTCTRAASSIVIFKDELHSQSLGCWWWNKSIKFVCSFICSCEFSRLCSSNWGYLSCMYSTINCRTYRKDYNWKITA